LGTPIEYRQYRQILTLTSESNGKKRLDFLKFGVPAVPAGRSVEWNIGMVHNCGINAHMWNMGIIISI
jgi:hypothetical protein